jgi:16S rRNA (cytosine1402-N4)-methyltransferase
VHTSVLQQEVIKYLSPKPNENFVDCTLGWGGHSFSILEKNAPNGKVLGIDWDKESLKRFCAQCPESERRRLILANGNFSEVKRIVKDHNFGPVAGVIMDLGMSSWHLSESGRGFSFSNDETLDMRYSSENEKTAKELLNELPRDEIERILREYGEERFARSIAKKIALARRARAIETTSDLTDIIKKSIPSRYRFGKTHFATRTFQALRIAVNRELDNLEAALPQAHEILAPGGRLAVIAFHSLEDRIVKVRFREYAKEFGSEILTKKPITPSGEELENNPRSRSAKLRIIKKPEAKALAA